MIRPEIEAVAMNNFRVGAEQVLLTATVNYTHKFNPNTILTNTFLAEAGAQNTMVQDNIQLAVKMTTKLALTVGYGITDNSAPPAPLKKVDTISTVNLQYSF